MESNLRFRQKSWLRKGEETLSCLILSRREKPSLHTFCLFQQRLRLRLPRQYGKWVRAVVRLSWCYILNVQTALERWLNALLCPSGHPGEDPIEKLLKLEPHKVDTLKKVQRGEETCWQSWWSLSFTGNMSGKEINKHPCLLPQVVIYSYRTFMKVEMAFLMDKMQGNVFFCELSSIKYSNKRSMSSSTAHYFGYNKRISL